MRARATVRAPRPARRGNVQVAAEPYQGPPVALLWEEWLSGGFVDPCHNQVRHPEGPDPASTWEPTEAGLALLQTGGAR